MIPFFQSIWSLAQKRPSTNSEFPKYHILYIFHIKALGHIPHYSSQLIQFPLVGDEEELDSFCWVRSHKLPI